MFTFMSLKLSMARRNLTIGMSDTGMSSRHIAVQFNVNHTVIGRLIQRYHQTSCGLIMDLNVRNWTGGKVQMNFNENRFNNLPGY
jgi:IS30 family transposase